MIYQLSLFHDDARFHLAIEGVAEAWCTLAASSIDEAKVEVCRLLGLPWIAWSPRHGYRGSDPVGWLEARVRLPDGFDLTPLQRGYADQREPIGERQGRPLPLKPCPVPGCRRHRVTAKVCTECWRRWNYVSRMDPSVTFDEWLAAGAPGWIDWRRRMEMA